MASFSSQLRWAPQIGVNLQTAADGSTLTIPIGVKILIRELKRVCAWNSLFRRFPEPTVKSARIDMNGRVYDPSIGRMISADPTVPNPSYSQAFNRYAYVYNNPLSATDPSGYCPTGEFICPDTGSFPFDIVPDDYRTALNVRNEIDTIFSRSKRTQDAGEVAAAVIDDYFGIPWVEAGYAGYIDRLNGESQFVAGRDFIESLAITESTNYMFEYLSNKFPSDGGLLSTWWSKLSRLDRIILKDTAEEYIKEDFVRLKHETVQLSKTIIEGAGDLIGDVIGSPILDPGNVAGKIISNPLDPGNLFGGLFGGSGHRKPPGPGNPQDPGGAGSGNYISHPPTAQQ